MSTLADPSVVKYYDDAFKAGNDKRYPTVNLVRLELRYFEHKPGRLLEYAFGTGCNLIHLLECGHDVDAIDTSPHAADLVRRKLQERPDLAPRARLHVLDGSAERLPFEDGTFDYINCMSVLSLLGSKDRIGKLMAEFSRVMKSGGKLVADINGPDSFFAKDGEAVGDDVYEYRGGGGKGAPIPCVCPTTADSFATMIEPYFDVDDVGFTAHRFLTFAEQEFIVCAHKS